MSEETIYLSEYDDGTYSFHKMEVDYRSDERISYSVGPWEKDSQWYQPAFEYPTSVKFNDHGDGVRMTVYGKNKQQIELDYSHLIDLMMLLDTYDRHQTFKSTFKRFEEKND